MAIVILIALRMTSSIFLGAGKLPEDDDHRLIGEERKGDMTAVT